MTFSLKNLAPFSPRLRTEYNEAVAAARMKHNKAASNCKVTVVCLAIISAIAILGASYLIVASGGPLVNPSVFYKGVVLAGVYFTLLGCMALEDAKTQKLYDEIDSDFQAKVKVKIDMLDNDQYERSFNAAFCVVCQFFSHNSNTPPLKVLEILEALFQHPACDSIKNEKLTKFSNNIANKYEYKKFMNYLAGVQSTFPHTSAALMTNKQIASLSYQTLSLFLANQEDPASILNFLTSEQLREFSVYVLTSVINGGPSEPLQKLLQGLNSKQFCLVASSVYATFTKSDKEGLTPNVIKVFETIVQDSKFMCLKSRLQAFLLENVSEAQREQKIWNMESIKSLARYVEPKQNAFPKLTTALLADDRFLSLPLEIVCPYLAAMKDPNKLVNQLEIKGLADYLFGSEIDLHVACNLIDKLECEFPITEKHDSISLGYKWFKDIQKNIYHDVMAMTPIAMAYAANILGKDHPQIVKVRDEMKTSIRIAFAGNLKISLIF